MALHVAEEGAGAGGELAGELIDLADVREPAQGDDDGQAHGAGVSGRDSAADEAGVAALRQHCDARFGAGSDNPGDLGGRAGPHDCEARAGEPSGPVGGVGSDEFGGCEDVTGAHDLAKHANNPVLVVRLVRRIRHRGYPC